MTKRQELEELIRHLIAADPYAEIEPTEEGSKEIVDQIMELFLADD